MIFIKVPVYWDFFIIFASELKDKIMMKNENITPWIATHPGNILKYEL